MPDHPDTHSLSRSEGLRQFDDTLLACVGQPFTPYLAAVVRTAAIHYGHACAGEVLRETQAIIAKTLGPPEGWPAEPPTTPPQKG